MPLIFSTQDQWNIQKILKHLTLTIFSNEKI